MVVASTWKISRNRKACASGFSPDEKKIRLHLIGAHKRTGDGYSPRAVSIPNGEPTMTP
jgi:hypothetical protein